MTSDQPTTKSELMRCQLEGRKRWEALLARVPPELITEPGVKGKLSVKDIVAHLAAWERHATERFRALARGEEPEPLPPPGMAWPQYEHAFNARVYEKWRDRSYSEVRAEAEDAYAQFLSAASVASEEVLFRPDRPAWKAVAFNGYLHYLDFADAVVAWLDRRSS